MPVIVGTKNFVFTLLKRENLIKQWLHIIHCDGVLLRKFPGHRPLSMSRMAAGGDLHRVCYYPEELRAFPGSSERCLLVVSRLQEAIPTKPRVELSQLVAAYSPFTLLIHHSLMVRSHQTQTIFAGLFIFICVSRAAPRSVKFSILSCI